MNFLASSCCLPILTDSVTERLPLLQTRRLPQYVYQALASDEIRVLVVHPARNFEDDIVLHVQTRKRSDEQYYEAVSYAWGTDKSESALSVYDGEEAARYFDGQNAFVRLYRYNAPELQTQSSLRVRDNVAMMLRYLRHRWSPRNLWIDALSINQDDPSEKNQQVVQMGEIYRGSARTLIWLGYSRIYSTPLADLGVAIRGYRLFQGRSADEADTQIEEQQEEYMELPTEGRYLLSLPWFRRRWVIQEAALSPRPRVIFGHDEMTFEDLAYLVDRLWKRCVDIPPYISDAIHLLQTMTSLNRRRAFRGNGLITDIIHDVYDQYYRHHPKSNEPADIIQLLVSMHAAKCANDRDRLYALNSLQSKPMPVDYRKRTNDVFREFAKSEYTYSLETIYCCGAFPSKTLPSWIADWRSPRQWIPFKSFEGRRASHQMLSESPRCPNEPPQKPIFIGSSVMVVNAVIFTFVATKGPQLFDSWSFNPWICLGKYLDFYHRATTANPSLQSTNNARDLSLLMQTLTAGEIRSGANLKQWLEAYDSSQSHKKTRKEYIGSCCACKDISLCEYPQAHSNICNILERIEQILKGRCIFVTDSGHWAIGPASLLSGDLIVALPGCRYPLALRPKVSQSSLDVVEKMLTFRSCRALLHLQS